MIIYKSVKSIAGPLVVIENTQNVGYQEIVFLTDENGQKLNGQVIALEGTTAIVQLFSSASGFKIDGSEAVFAGETKKMALSPTLLGKTFTGSGKDFETGKEPEILPLAYRDINGAAINPFRRSEPKGFIQTGVSSIDLTNTVVKGQKIPIFSGNGLPDLQLLTQIAANAKTSDPNEKFVVIVAGMGITNDQYEMVKKSLEQTGAIHRSIMFVNLASDPVVERIMTPRLALTASEYFAYDLGYSVLTLTFDLTNYANALREVSSAKKEIPGRQGYPGYLYTDLATLLERAGTVEGLEGSITQIPILTMPNDDKTSVVPDLTGYITEGQIVLSRESFKKGIYPPVDILSSLSRLKDKGQGAQFTREDHSQVADQMFACLSESINQLELSFVLGKDSLSDIGKLYLEFNERYYSEFLNQQGESRTIIQTLDIAWNLFKILPRVELKKLKDKTIEKYAPEILTNQ
jgi:V/A-type H+-transporting ATPase subunit B